MTKDEQFDLFWKAFPRRVAKGHARTAFEKAIRKTDLATMLAAIADYIRFKPERIDFKHPATWLNGECWSDEWASVPRETGRKRNFVDAARDRFNGQRGADGNHTDAQRFSGREFGCGFDDGDLRAGNAGFLIDSRH